MPSKFKFSLDSADATARQFSDIKRQLQDWQTKPEPCGTGRE